MDAFLELFKLGSVGLIAGLFSAFLAARDHRYKKWWELRVAAYQELIEALSNMYHYFQTWHRATIERHELNPSQEEDLKKIWDSSYHKVRLAADSGAFLYSDEVNSILGEFMALRHSPYDTWFDYLDDNLVTVEKSLEAVVALSKKDLKIKSSWIY